MKLYQILLPMSDNAGNPTLPAHQKFRSELLRLVGGCTSAPHVNGVWRDEAGTEYVDTLAPYSVACEPAQWSAIVARAFELFPDQLAIFHCELGNATIENRPAVAHAA